MDKLSSINGLMISQQKEWGEILTGFETKNKYVVMDPEGKRLYLAAETKGSLIMRWALKALRPFTIDIMSEDGKLALRVKRPFKFYFHEAEIQDPQGQKLGKIKKKFSVVRKKYIIEDKTGQEIYQLFGPALRPWTFKIKSGDIEHGQITKKWSGFFKEAMSDADNFGVIFPGEWDNKLKALFLGAVFLIDFVHFENKSN